MSPTTMSSAARTWIIILLASLVGRYCLPAVGIILIVIPFQYYFGYCIIANKTANSPHMVERFSIIQVRSCGNTV